MKKNYLKEKCLTAAMLMTLGCFASLAIPLHAQSRRKVDKILSDFGLVRINDSVFIDQYEATNLQWQQYLVFLRTTSPENLNRALPDSIVWIDYFGLDPIADSADYFESMRIYTNPALGPKPVVGISHGQAEQFCGWKTFAIGARLRQKAAKRGKNYFLNRYNIDIYFRLPTEKEWIEAASNEYSIAYAPYGYDRIYTKPPILFTVQLINEIESALERRLGVKPDRHQLKRDIFRFSESDVWPVFNCRYGRFELPYFLTVEDMWLPKGFHYFRGTRIWSDVMSGVPNSKNLHHTIGNVAEMIQREGVAKGGSWHHQLDDSKIQDRQRYEKPEAWLGFRCVGVVKVTPKM